MTARPRLRYRTGDASLRGDAAPGVIAHAGLAAGRPGGAPTFESLHRALRLGVDAVEVDVCLTADGTLVLHHDARDAGGTPLDALTLHGLRAQIPELLTLDEAVRILGYHTHVVLDIKTPSAVQPLARWLSRNPGHGRVTVCTDRTEALQRISTAAPGTGIWQTFPQIGARNHERVMRVLMSLLAHRRGYSRRLAADVWDTALHLRRQPRSALSHLAGLPWRALLPQALVAVRHELHATGISAHHSLVTPELCDIARSLDLTVTAWTVNTTAVAARMRACGADLVTTDDVAAVRAA